MTTCPKHAAYRFTWPGYPESNICKDHAISLRSIAEALDLPLQLIPIELSLEYPFLQCNQKISPNISNDE